MSRRNSYRRTADGVGIAIGIYAVVAFCIWLIVMAAIVAVAGDILGLWNAVSFV